MTGLADKAVLVTGATGLVGSHLVDRLLAGGARVRCLVRREPPYEWLDASRVELVHGDCTRPATLPSAVAGADIVYHSAAVTWAARESDYERNNVQGTLNLLQAVREHAPGISRFVFISSQSAGGPTRTARPRKESDTDDPVTPYGRSKLAAEGHVLSCKDHIPAIILRPSAVYGPRDRTFLPIFKLLARKILIQFGSEDRLVSFCHVFDLVTALVTAGQFTGVSGSMFYIAESAPRYWSDVEKIMADAMGVSPRRVVVGWSLLTLMGYIGQIYGATFSRPVKVNRTRMRELLETDWSLDTSALQKELGVTPRYSIDTALQELVEWYRRENWL